MPEYRIIAYRGRYALEWQENGVRRRKSLRTSDRADLEQAVQRAVRELEAQGGNNPGPKLVVLWEGYRNSLGDRPHGLSLDKRRKTTLDFFGSLPPEEITETVVDAYITKRASEGLKPGTVRAELKLLRSILSWGEKRGLIAKAPWIKVPPASPPKDLHLTRLEAQEFLAACRQPHVKLFVTLALATGARMQALLDLTWDRIDWDRRLITLADPLRKHQGKNRPVVPINDFAFQALWEARGRAKSRHVVEWAGQRIGRMQESLRTVGKRCGLEWVTAHVFRHSAAVWMAEDGVPMAQIAQFLGHSDSRITEKVYARFSPGFLHNAAASLDLQKWNAVPNEPGQKAIILANLGEQPLVKSRV